MRVTGVVADLRVPDIESARDFYQGFLGLEVEEFNMGWVARYTSPDGLATVQLVTRDAAAPENPVISVHAGAQVEEGLAEAHHRGYEIVYPLSAEPWGLRRFFVRAPDGNVVNVTSHPGD